MADQPYTPREMRLIGERDAALCRAEIPRISLDVEQTRALLVGLLHLREEVERHQGQPAHERLVAVYQELVAAVPLEPGGVSC